MQGKTLVLAITFLLFGASMGFALTPAGNVTCGQALDTAGAAYTMNASSTIAAGNCFNVTAANVTLDCAGYSITGNNPLDIYGDPLDVWGVTTNQFNTTIKNCNISYFTYGILFNSSNGSVQNTTVTANVTNKYAFRITGSNNTISNLTAYSAAPGGNLPIDLVGAVNNIFTNIIVNTTSQGMAFSSGSNFNTISNSFLTTIGDAISIASSTNNTFSNLTTNCTSTNSAFYISSGDGNIITNSFLTGKYMYVGSSNNVVANSTITATNTSTYAIRFTSSGLNNTLINTTLISSSTTAGARLLYISSPASGNIICLNNFTNTATGVLYVEDQSGTNYYNCTFDAKNQGNLYANVVSGSPDIYGLTSSSITNHYIGNLSGPYDALPYNSTNSLGKLLGNIIDYAPISPRNTSSGAGVTSCRTLSIANTVYNLSSNVSINSSTCFTITAPNVTLDCNGYSITGNNITSTYGFYSDQFNTTIRNCIISNFDYGVSFNGATYGTIFNVTSTSDSNAGVGIVIGGIDVNGSFNSVINSTGVATSGGGTSTGIRIGIGFGSGVYSSNRIINSTGNCSGGCNGYGIAIINGNNNIVTNSISFAIAPGYGLALAGGSAINNTIANSSIVTTGTSGYGIRVYSNANNNNMINNTLSSGGTGIYIYDGADNNSIDCQGRAMVGKQIYNTYGIYSTQFNTTINNCNISNFSRGINFVGATNGSITNSYISSTFKLAGAEGHAVELSTNSNGNRISNTTLESFSTVSVVTLNVYQSSNNTFDSLTVKAQNGFAVAIESASLNNSLVNSIISGQGSSGDGSSGAMKVSRENIIQNNTINGLGGSNAVFLGYSTGIIFINNTISNATNLIYINSDGAGITICLNNFSNTAGTYITDTNGSNFYNCTYDGKNQGNIYANVLNGSVQIAGNVSSSFPGLYLGTRGSGYPYNNSTSGGKLIGAIVDYAPLTYFSNLNATMTSVEILNPTGGYVISFSSLMRGWSSATDDDNNTVSYQYNWQLQGGANDSMNTSTTNFTQGVNVNAYNKSTFATRQVYTLYARAFDGSNYSDWLQSYPIIVTNNGYAVSGILNASSNTVPVISLETPANGSSTPSTSVQYRYNVTYHNTYTVELWLDGTMIEQRDYSLNHLNLSTDRTIQTTYTYTTAPGTHTYYIKAKDITNATYQQSPTYTFTVLANATGFTGSYNISQAAQATVYGSPQRVWYDEFGTLYAMYFYSEPATNNSSIAITSINPSLGTPLQYYTATMNRTNDFFVGLRYPNSTTRMISYDSNTSSQKSVVFGLGAISIITNSTIFNISTNEYYDPYAYAYSSHHQTISYSASSLGLYWMPTYNDSHLIIQSIPSTTEASINSTPISNIAWQTFANDSSLETWLYAYPENCTGNFTVKLYKYDGTVDTQTYFANPDTTCYSTADIENTKTMFETYNGTHYFIQNSPEATTIYQINNNKAVKITEAITSIGYLLFIDANTFVFYGKEGTTDYAFSCNFAGAGECIKNDATNYLGSSTIIYRGVITSMTRDGVEDVIKGQIAAGSSYTTLFYNLNRFDAKLACYDEVNLNILKGNFRIQSGTYGVAMTPGTEAWAFAISSTPFGSGIKQIYSFCQNGTSRQYFPTSINQTDTFSLNDTSPNAYYTFLVQDCFAQPVSNALVTARRFLNDRQNWTIIEQAYSSVGGDAVLFLEPITTYQMTVLAPDGITNNFVFIPSTTASTTIPMACASQTINVTPTVEHVYQNLSYRIMAKTVNGTIITNGMTNQSFNISFNTSSPGYIYWTNMQIWKTDGSGERVNIYNETVNTSTGTYRTFFFNSTSGAAYYDMYMEINTLKSITNTSNLSTANESQRVTITARAYVQLVPYNAVIKDLRININSAFCGANYDGKSACGGAWAWIFISTVITMLVVGYVSRFTLDGAGIIGAGMFMLLALVNPVILGVAGILIPMWAIGGIVIIVTLMLIIWRYL